MKKIDIPLILDVIFYTVSAWFLCIGILRYFRVTLWIAVLAASLLALAAGGICFVLIYGNHRRVSLSKAARARREKLMLHLTLERDERVKEALKAAYEADGKEANLEDGTLRIGGEILEPLFTMQPVSADAVAVLIRSYGEEPFTLACNALTPEAEKLLLSFGRKYVCGDEIFTLFERTETTPEKLILGELPRPKIRAKFRRAFSKRNARPFFTGGILLLVMSLFTFFPLYYLISGCILLVSAVFVRMLGYA